MTRTVTRNRLHNWAGQITKRENQDDIYSLLLEPVIESFWEANKEQIEQIDEFIKAKNDEYFVMEEKNGIMVPKTRMVHKLSSIKDKVKPAPVREFVMQPGKTQENYKKEIDDFLNQEIEITL